MKTKCTVKRNKIGSRKQKNMLQLHIIAYQLFIIRKKKWVQKNWPLVHFQRNMQVSWPFIFFQIRDFTVTRSPLQICSHHRICRQKNINRELCKCALPPSDTFHEFQNGDRAHNLTLPVLPHGIITVHLTLEKAFKNAKMHRKVQEMNKI